LLYVAVMRAIAVAVLIALAPGCTILLPVGAGMSTARHNRERKAMIAAGVPPEQVPEEDNGHQVIGAFGLGLVLDVVLVAGLAYMLSGINDYSGAGDH
jgi:hypothetical protein